jgi:hypothetical protein
MMRLIGTVVEVDAGGHPLVLLDGSEEGGEVTALRAGNYTPEPGDRCVVTQVGLKFVAEFAIV